jgi:uridine kinase
MKIIGIAGGSGSGKTTLARRLAEKYPDKIDMINLDKYKKVSENTSNLPRVNGIIDWDHPVTNDWDKLLADIKTLQGGSPVTIDIWTLGDDPQNPQYKIVKSRTIYPRDILIIEGYLALWHPNLRKLYARSYFLLMSREARLQRRDRVVTASYDKEIHIPIHNEHVEPTKKYADILLDVSNLSEDEVFEKVTEDLKKPHLLK